MTAYVTAEFTPKDQEMLQAYSAKAATTIAEFEGEFLIKAPIQTLGGKTNFTYKAIIAFPSGELANAWFNSEQYQSLIEIREKGMDANFLLISI